VISENLAAKIPDGLTFEQGALIPMSVGTAAAAMFGSMKIPYPDEQKSSGGFLVWGAAGGVGSSAVQLARAAGFEVFATASPHNVEFLKKLGASEVFDYKDVNVADNIIAAAKAKGVTIGHAFDTVSLGSTPGTCAKIVSATGGGKLAMTLDWPQDAKKPENVEVLRAGVFTVMTSNKPLGTWVYHKYLPKALADGSYVPAPGILSIEGGIGGIQKALDTQKAGVSGKKVVVPIA